MSLQRVTKAQLVGKTEDGRLRAGQVKLQAWPLSSNCLLEFGLNLIFLFGKLERFVLDNHFYWFNIIQFNDFKKFTLP